MVYVVRTFPCAQQDLPLSRHDAWIWPAVLFLSGCMQEGEILSSWPARNSSPLKIFVLVLMALLMHLRLWFEKSTFSTLMFQPMICHTAKHATHTFLLITSPFSSHIVSHGYLASMRKEKSFQKQRLLLLCDARLLLQAGQHTQPAVGGCVARWRRHRACSHWPPPPHLTAPASARAEPSHRSESCCMAARRRTTCHRYSSRGRPSWGKPS
jgi:hypothetical protein